jgi:lipid A ethanolaminephosphotransferase
MMVLTALFLLLTGNLTFFGKFIDAYPLGFMNGLYLLSVAILLGSLNVLLLSLICYRYTIKPVLITLLMVTAGVAYFMDSYHIVIDEPMIDNILRTDPAESFDLLSLKLMVYLLLLGVLLSLLVYRTGFIEMTFRQAVMSRMKLIVGAIVIGVATVLVFGSFYASFAREHKNLRYFINPSYYLNSVGRFVGKSFASDSKTFVPIAPDAKREADGQPRRLVVLVVGETARADHFSLNGYARETNPLLAKEKVASFRNTWSCGTTTAVSLPCMFSIYGRADYEREKALQTENILDLLQRTGVNLVWLDNNSDSKGVALRVPYENYKVPEKNPVCDEECRDEGMLAGLQQYIDQHPSGDLLVVLHQMGNHGPAYYKRYPAAFEKFTPTCQTNQLEQCSREEIDNAYDNAILYTDYFLSKLIALLKQQNDRFASTMYYISDHGESLGENNLYLHGLPYLFAPDVQKHVPMIFWFSDSARQAGLSVDAMLPKLDEPFSHDSIFHTLLGLFHVQTDVYDPKLDLSRLGSED